MIVWFVVIALTGVMAIARDPAGAGGHRSGLCDHAAAHARRRVALAIIGAVFLALTGGEALYADMGHFGKAPVRIAWFALVWPALVLNYFGQGALLLERGHMVDHPLYALVPQERCFRG